MVLIFINKTKRGVKLNISDEFLERIAPELAEDREIAPEEWLKVDTLWKVEILLKVLKGRGKEERINLVLFGDVLPVLKLGNYYHWMIPNVIRYMTAEQIPHFLNRPFMSGYVQGLIENWESFAEGETATALFSLYKLNTFQLKAFFEWAVNQEQLENPVNSLYRWGMTLSRLAPGHIQAVLDVEKIRNGLFNCVLGGHTSCSEWRNLLRPLGAEQIAAFLRHKKVQACLKEAITDIRRWGDLFFFCESEADFAAVFGTPIIKIQTDKIFNNLDLLGRVLRGYETDRLEYCLNQIKKQRLLFGLLFEHQDSLGIILRYLGTQQQRDIFIQFLQSYFIENMGYSQEEAADSFSEENLLQNAPASGNSIVGFWQSTAEQSGLSMTSESTPAPNADDAERADLNALSHLPS